MAPSPFDDDPEITARPTERPLAEPDDEHVVPLANVGGAAPTPAGLDSGGNLPGPEDDLGTLYGDEPETAPEIAAVQVREEDEENPP
jgi:hypothetical protein